MKPVINLDELEIKYHEGGPFKGSYGDIGSRIGAKKLGYNLTICPPGKSVCPFHNHHINEEMVLILEGQGTLRFGDQKYPLRKNDVIAFPPGKCDVAHRIDNTGTTDLKYLALSTNDRNDVCEYPDSNKVGIFIGEGENTDLRVLFRAEQGVEYLDRETRMSDDFEGTLILERLAQADKLDDFYDAIDSDDFRKAASLMLSVGIDDQTVAIVMQKMADPDGEH